MVLSLVKVTLSQVQSCKSGDGLPKSVTQSYMYGQRTISCRGTATTTCTMSYQVISFEQFRGLKRNFDGR